MKLTPLGDQGLLAACDSEAEAIALAHAVRAAGWPEVVDVVPAYRSVAVFHDPERIALAALHDRLARLSTQPSSAPAVGRLHVIPCCYELGADLGRVADHVRMPPRDVIDWHCGAEYTVYAIGFCPGFPYLGYLPDALAGVPRLPTPRVRVDPGSVGLTGRQTGIYPIARPGGWNLIGRTPLTLVDVAAGYFPLRVGDRVRFAGIDREEYERRRGERLPEIGPK
jgi:inhibitor of KinA